MPSRVVTIEARAYPAPVGCYLDQGQSSSSDNQPIMNLLADTHNRMDATCDLDSGYANGQRCQRAAGCSCGGSRRACSCDIA